MQLSPIEKKSVIIVSVIILAGFIIESTQPKIVQTDLYDYSLQDSLFNKRSGWNKDTVIIQEKSGSTKKKKPKKNSLIPGSININKADQKELERLPRIGPSIARNIIEYREEHGDFKSKEDLLKVKRIGPKTLKLISEYIFIENKDSLDIK